MAKTKTPFFSLGSRGSIGNQITTQARNGATLVREKPKPTYRRTLAQMYIRWLYIDYAYRWTLQSVATKQLYTSDGVVFHLTGFQYWMKYHLKNMPDIVAWWTLDNIVGTDVLDRSPNNYHCTVWGVVETTGFIGGALSFDGLNDMVYCDSIQPSLISQDCTIEALIKISDNTQHRRLGGSRQAAAPQHGWEIYQHTPSGTIRFLIDTPAGALTVASTSVVTDDAIHHVCFKREAGVHSVYVDGAFENSGALAGSMSSPDNTYLGRSPLTTVFWKGVIDNFIIYNRPLDDTEILRHSGRRYAV